MVARVNLVLVHAFFYMTHELKPRGVLNIWGIAINRDKSIKRMTYPHVYQALPTQESENLSVNVDVFILNPLCCFQCKKFGHGEDACKTTRMIRTTPVVKTRQMFQLPGYIQRLSCLEKGKAHSANKNWKAAKLPRSLKPGWGEYSKVSNRTIMCQTKLTWLTVGKTD